MLAQPAAMAAMPTNIALADPLDFIGCLSALDGGRIERGAVGVACEEGGESDRRVRGELEVGETLLAVAIVQAPLEGAQFTLGHAVRGPGRVSELRPSLLGEVRQVLQAGALSRFSRAG